MRIFLNHLLTPLKSPGFAWLYAERSIHQSYAIGICTIQKCLFAKGIFQRVFVLLMLLVLAPDAKNLSDNVLVVGTKTAPPFSMKNRAGEWEGMSIELWDLIAKRLGLTYRFEEHTLKSLLDSVFEKKLDVAIAAITITAEREKMFDFTHSYYTTGLSIAVPKKNTAGWWSVLRGIFSYEMFVIVAALGLILLIIGMITWLVERKRNPENFHPHPLKGIASGIWWAAVTMTTVGYGDMTPKTLGGRLIALFWMFASLLLVSSIIAGVASTLTVAKMEHLISTPEDLARGKIASIRHSVSDKYLQKRNIYPVYYENVYDGLAAVSEQKVDAMVYDAPLLQYSIKERFSDTLMMTGALFENQNYGIALPEGSPLREQINRVMLEIMHSKAWENIQHKYLGRG